MQITFEEALEIARELKPDIDHCTEYEHGFLFSKLGETDLSDPSVVVLKEDGRAVNQLWYQVTFGYEFPISERSV